MSLKFLLSSRSIFQQTEDCSSLKESFGGSEPEASYTTIGHDNALSAECLQNQVELLSQLRLQQPSTIKKPQHTSVENPFKRENATSRTCQEYQKQYFEKRPRMVSVQFLSFLKQLVATACENKNHCQEAGLHQRNYRLCRRLSESELFTCSYHIQFGIFLSTHRHLCNPIGANTPATPSPAAVSVLEHETSFGQSSAHLPSAQQELARSSSASCAQRHVIYRKHNTVKPSA